MTEKRHFGLDLDAFEEHALLTAVNTGLGVIETKGDDSSKAIVAALRKVGMERGMLQKVGESYRWNYHPQAFTSTDRDKAFREWKRSIE